MATTNVSNVAYPIFDGKRIYAPDLSGVKPVVVGQIVMFDATLNGALGGVRPAVTQADMATYVGICEQNSILNSLLEQLPSVRVGFKNVYYMNTTPAEVYTQNQKVFFNETAAGGLQITSNTNSGARTVAAGYIELPPQSVLAGLLSVTGAAGVQVPVAIVAVSPVVGIA